MRTQVLIIGGGPSGLLLSQLLSDINIDIVDKSIQVIMGLSGSGKSTLIRHINRLIEPTAGNVLVDGSDVLKYDENALREFRRTRTAMVFQRFALMPHMTILKNVSLGLELQGKKEEEIRNAIINIQRDAYDSDKGLIADGRDMGTIIFPEAALKVFLQASPEVRAERRANQLKEKGMSVIMHDLLEQIQQRDEEDMNRKISPLKKTKDSLLINTTNLNKRACFLKIKKIIDRKINN